MEQELDYAEMLEIPVSTVNVVKKKQRRNLNMSIYKKEASLEEMKREAIRRMELLKLDARTIRDFERDGSVSLSQQIGDQIFLQPSDDEISARVKRFEQGYECLVYHVLWADSPMVGECWSLLFVSPASSDWKGEQKYINSSGLIYAYVESEMEDGVSEIMVQPQDGGLIRLG